MPLLPLLASALLPLVAQVGPFTQPGTGGTPFPEKVERPRKAPSGVPVATPAPPSVAGSPHLQECLAAVDDDAEDAADQAAAWLKAAKGREAAEAQLCLGSAQVALEDWPAAEKAFLAGRELAGADRLLRVRLGGMAGNAALAGQAPARALGALDVALAEGRGLADAVLVGGIQLDRARALVALGRAAEAEAPLAEARKAQPDNPEAWLLSATLARRLGHLAEAEARIQRAAELLPVDPAIGLEAGVIAMLAGHEDAARKSWESVLKVAPDSAQAETAKGYLAQLGGAEAGTAMPSPASGPATGR